MRNPAAGCRQISHVFLHGHGESVARWFYSANIPHHVIGDFGGWKLAHRDAMDGYPTTEPTRAMQVRYDL